jgi:hypothetical protein
MQNFQKHFLAEDFEELNKQINRIHINSLAAIECSLDGDIKAAEMAGHQILKALEVVRALHTKKLTRDQHELAALGTRKNWF